MSARVGIVVFARYDSTRLPGKALRPVGGMPLLERVIRRAQLCALPVFLATTERPSDDALVALAETLGVQSFRGSSVRVLDRAVLAAEAFRLDAFVRLCGDRPLFPLDELHHAVAAMRDSAGSEGSGPVDLVTTYRPGVTVRGLTTEVIHTAALRNLMDQGVSTEQQEHVTTYFYENPNEFRIVEIDSSRVDYTCPGFALDTVSDLHALNKIFAVSEAIDMSPIEADRKYAE